MSAVGLNIWDLAGLALLAVFGYLAVTRLVMPQFALPILGRKQRRLALERASTMLEDDDLDDEVRSRLVMWRNTLRAYDAEPRELWSGSLPVSDVVKRIEELWEDRSTNQT